MIQQLIQQTERKAKQLHNQYDLWLNFMPKKEAQHRLITELNQLMNDAIFSFGGKRIWLYNWKNVFKRERQGIAENKFSNIVRVITTELHRRYNEVLNDKWKEDPTIIGRRIRLSRTGKNHCEVCKNMAGVYPLSFEWTMWHIRCQCEQFPVYGKPNQKIKIPNRAKRFVALNRERFKNWKTEPYWLKYF